MATGSEGAGFEESAAAAVVTQLSMNDDAAAAKPASSKSYGVKARSEQGRNNKSQRQAARRKERAEGQTGASDAVPPETEAEGVTAELSSAGHSNAEAEGGSRTCISTSGNQ